MTYGSFMNIRGGMVRIASVAVLCTAVATHTGSGAGAAPTSSTTDGSVVALPDSEELLYSNEGNRLRRYDVDTIGTARVESDILIERAADGGRDVNGEICFLPDGSGSFIAGEDTGQPDPPAGWGVFDADGNQIGKLTATYLGSNPEPFGCAFAPNGTLFTSEVGAQGFATPSGQLIVWFADGSFCKLATDLGTAGAVEVDSSGNVYVAQASGLSVEKFAPPFPTSADAAGGCGNTDSTGAPLADTVQRSTFITPSNNMLTFSGLAPAPGGGLYASSVLTGHIAEYDTAGNFVRSILAPGNTSLPIITGNPQGLAVGADGALYYADLDLVGELPDVGPGPDGRIWRIDFDGAGNPLPPIVIRDGLRFPDGLAIAPGNLERDESVVDDWPTFAGGPSRTFFNPNEQHLTASTVPSLIEKWRFPTGAVVTASPTIAPVTLPDGSSKRLVFVASWDGFVYAIDFADGQEEWRYAWTQQPGASFPAAASVTVTDVDGDRVVLIGAGQTMHALDAATGAERWTFAAGTGCGIATGDVPGGCGFDGERNQVESTPVVANQTAYFGMDINDVATGKGGFYAVDVTDGTMVWYFDVETGATCRPDPGDAIRRFDGYNSEEELGLPGDFFETRSGCDHDRTTTGCGNVWSSPAYDPERDALYFGTSNCDTDNDPGTPLPGPNMPPYDEALVALGTDGVPQWRWRPREIDPDDLAFGAVPNLFSIDVNGSDTDVVGIGGKDGVYYVIDRDGINETSGLAWNDPNPRALPYWETQVVDGGAIGGIIATASVDTSERRVYFSTAPGFDVGSPQRPTVHALDLDTGDVVWQNTDATTFPAGDASYAPTSAVPGVVIVGSVITPHLRMYDATDGTLLFDEVVGDPGTFSGIASGAAVVDGTVVVGAGIGARTSTGSSPGDFAADTPSVVVALCVPGSPDCGDTRPVVIPGEVTVVEGDAGVTIASVPVTLSAPSNEVITAPWQVISVFPEVDGDVTPASGVAEFAPGQTETTVEIEVIGDRLDEDDEVAVVAFGTSDNARIGGFWGLGLVGILDDDPPPLITLGVGVANESAGTVSIPVFLTEVSGRDVVIEWRTIDATATAPDDYAASTSSLVIAAGDRFASISVELHDDNTKEPPEFFLLRADAGSTGEVFNSLAFAFVFDDD